MVYHNRREVRDDMTREEMKQKIDSFVSDSDRKVANILLEHTLPQMQSYCERKIEELKQQLLDEKMQEINKYEIAITVCEREKIDLYEDMLFAMNVSDVTGREYFMEEDSLCIPVWIAADDKEILQYKADRIRGTIHTTSGEFAVEFKLVKNTTYLDVLQQCREAFAGNGLCWKEVNEAYLQKFFYLETSIRNIQTDTEIIGYSVKNQELNQRLHRNMIPLWNVRYITLPANDFPVIQEDRIHYRYDFLIPEKIEMLLDKAECRDGYGVRYQDRYSLYTGDNSKKQFIVWQIYANDFSKLHSEYAILTNGVKREMWSSQGQSRIVHSDFELSRCINTLAVSEKIVYKGYQVLQNYDKTFDYVVAREQSNELPMQKERSCLELIIHNAGLPQYLYRDTIQYVVNTIQSEFREYTVICKMENRYDS